MDQNQAVEDQCSVPPPSTQASNFSMKPVKLLSRCLLYLSNFTSHPLFSILTTSSLLIFLYLPRPLLPLLLSPVPLSSLLLLSSLLRFGSKPDADCCHQPAVSDQSAPKSEHRKTLPGLVPCYQNTIFFNSFAGWPHRGGPLEVIYEGYEGEEDDGSPDYSPSPEYSEVGGVGFGSLGLYFTDTDSNPDSDSDSNSDSNSMGNLCFGWDEDGEEEMIEIALDDDNLIEIDISDCRRC